MPTLSDNLTHAVIILAGIAALVVLAVNGNASGDTVVPIIAIAMGITGGVAATARGAAQALALPAGPTVGPTALPAPVAPTAASLAPDAGHLLGP